MIVKVPGRNESWRNGDTGLSCGTLKSNMIRRTVNMGKEGWKRFKETRLTHKRIKKGKGKEKEKKKEKY